MKVGSCSRASVEAADAGAKGALIKEERQNVLMCEAMQVQQDIVRGVYKPVRVCRDKDVCWLNAFQSELCKSVVCEWVREAWWHGCERYLIKDG